MIWKSQALPYYGELLGLPRRRLHGINQQDPSRMLRPRGKLSKRSEATACGNVQHNGEVRHPAGPRGESRNEIAFMFLFLLWLE